MTAPRDHGPSGDHAAYDALAVGWSLHALEPGEERSFGEHLPTCSRCQQTVREADETLAELAYASPVTEPPPELLGRIREAVGAPGADVPVRAAPRVVPSHRGPTVARPTRVLQLAAAALAVALIAGLAAWNVLLHQDAQRQAALAQQRQQVVEQLAHSVRKAVLRNSADQTVGYVVQHAGTLAVVTESLPQNDTATSTYVLWATGGTGAPPKALGTFDVTSGHVALEPVGSAPTGKFPLSGYAVSKEPGRQAPAKPSDVVASGAVES